ncbi:hypothetical protein HPMBJEAJ_00087 [Aeromonas phage avDM6]|nr:hypothetical protein HPMBJEAJ_00087 [Aeromonas phage avDM6]
MIFIKANTWKKLKIGDIFSGIDNQNLPIVAINHLFGQIRLSNGIELKFDSMHSYEYTIGNLHVSSMQWQYAFIDGALYYFGERKQLQTGDVVTITRYEDDQVFRREYIVKNLLKSDSFVVDMCGQEDVILTVGYGNNLISLYNDNIPECTCDNLEVGVTGLVSRILDERSSGGVI